MKWHHWCFFWVGTSSSFGTLCHNRSIWFFQGTNGVNKMKVRVIAAWSLGQEYLLRENTSNENSPVAFFWMLLWLSECRWYIRRVWLAMLVHTDANRVHVRSVGIVCLAITIRLVWLFDAIWLYLKSPCMSVRTQKMLGSPRTLLATTRWMWAEQNLKWIC